MCYNPRKLPEMLEITSFADAARVVYWGSQGIEILPEPKIVGYNPRKGPEMLEITILTTPLESCTGVTRHRHPPGNENRGL